MENLQETEIKIAEQFRKELETISQAIIISKQDGNSVLTAIVLSRMIEDRTATGQGILDPAWFVGPKKTALQEWMEGERKKNWKRKEGSQRIEHKASGASIEIIEITEKKQLGIAEAKAKTPAGGWRWVEALCHWQRWHIKNYYLHLHPTEGKPRRACNKKECEKKIGFENERQFFNYIGSPFVAHKNRSEKIYKRIVTRWMENARNKN